MRVAVVVAALAAVLALAVPAGAAQTGDVTVVHGFRGLVADVYVDGEQVLTGFAPERSTDPLPLPVGRRRVEVREAGADPDSEPALSGVLRVRAGDDVTAVVHADADGNPTLSVFDNPSERLAAGDARLVVRNTAASRPVAVLVNGRSVGQRVGPGQERGRRLQSGRHRVAVARSGDSRPLVPPADIRLDEGTATVLYLIGSAPDDSLGWIAQTVAGMQGAPRGVPSGDSGLAAPRPWRPSPVPLAAASAMLAGIVVLRRRFLPRA